MSTRPPPPPPREPQFLPPRPSTGRLVLKVALYVVGGFVLLVVVGVGLLWATCAGLA